jgi:hypothetical protein
MNTGTPGKLHDDEAGSWNANGVGDGGPQAAVDTGDAGAFAGVGDVLAGEPCGDDVDGLDRGPVDGTEVAEVGDARPMPGQDGAGVGVAQRKACWSSK